MIVSAETAWKRRAIEAEHKLEATREAHEADKKAFSDAVKKAIDGCGHNGIMAGCIQAQFSPFILPEPDPLVEIWKKLWPKSSAPESSCLALRNALADRGYKIGRIEQ